MVSTTNYGLYQPLVNNSQDEDAWGGEINTDLSEIDGIVYTAMNLTASTQTSTITVTAPTTGSTTTGSSNTLYLCNATGGAFAANLPAASTATNMVVAFKKTDSSNNAITITGHSTDTIDGVNTQSLASQYQYLVLECDGTYWNIIAQSSAAEIFSVNIKNFTSGGTYTPTAGMSYCIVEMWGGGGAGGGTSAVSNAVGAGGGAGGYSRALVSAATIGASQTVTIGAGGLAGANTGGTGGTGGTTSLGIILTAAGGVGGAGSTSNANPLQLAGGTGGAGTVNGVATRGMNGGNSISTSNGNGNTTGAGGSTSLGGGALAPSYAGSSINGISAVANSGGGGSGGESSGGAGVTGGVGGSGFILITEYIT